MLMNLLKPPVLLFLLFLLPGIESAAQTRAKNEETLLWQVSGKGLAGPSYIFGTYHLVGKDFIDTLPGIRAGFNRASIVVGEMLMDDPMAMAGEMMPYMVMENTTLDSLLTPGEYREVDTYLQKVSGMKLEMLKSFKPAAVMVIIATAIAPNTTSATNPPIDQYLQDEAKKQGKKVLGFETVKEQAEILLGSPLQRQKEQLLKQVRNPEKNLLESEKTYAMYKAQQLSAVQQLIRESDDSTEEEMAAVLYNRNLNWSKQLPELMKRGSVFVVVGAAHLPGEKGLLDLLRHSGYTVTPLQTRQL